MKKLNKKLILVITSVLLVILIILLFVNLNGNSTKENKIVIGSILPLTGKASQYGEEMKRGIELALENQDKVLVIYEDSQFDPKQGISSYYTLKSKNIPIIITAVSSVSLAISPLANQDKTIQMALATSNSEYSSKNDYTFRITTRSEVEDKELAKFVTNKNYRKVAIIYSNNAWGSGHYQTIKPELEKNNIAITSVETISANEVDFKTQLNKIKESNPEAILLLEEGKIAGLILKQAKELGIDMQFFGIRSLQSEEILTIAGDAAEGLVYTYPFDPNSDNPEIKDFVLKYKEKYNNIPTAYVAEGYDSTNLLIKAVKKCNDNTGCIKKYLIETEDYPGVLGKITFDENGDVYYPYFIKTIKNSQFISYD